jgi:hypothetical protein
MVCSDIYHLVLNSGNTQVYSQVSGKHVFIFCSIGAQANDCTRGA